ncbi:MAG: hypothetical protein JWO38_6170 [Gemmataceae bacterium]|nr:hypothetical protein [Gemmataceae bacterium]
MEKSHQLIADIRRRRGTDTVVAFEPAGRLSVDPAVLDRFAALVGLFSIGDQWREITREAAESLATVVLARDLAYSVQLMPDAEARELAKRFAREFAPDARFFTNTEYTAGASSWGWMPLTESTFDAGVLGVDVSTIGVLVVQDED